MTLLFTVRALAVLALAHHLMKLAHSVTEPIVVSVLLMLKIILIGCETYATLSPWSGFKYNYKHENSKVN